ncbi:MAG: hypothetical protein IPK64_20135, partial [bacterium]|nr:hypothetical protein [bacterium]
ALVGLWRKLEVGSAPKAINFSGNLIGYSRRATIDVWAARYLRDLASRAVSAVSFARVPPVAEKGVGGKVGKDLLPGGEFGFGQDVMAEAARMLRESGMPAFRDTQADDLQAVVWFLEKERWGTNAWTSKTGEGGSFELEANLAGDPDREGIADLRRRANAGVPKNIREQYEPGRQKDLQKHAAKVDAAKEELRRRQSPVDAFIGGLSPSMSETTQGVDFKPSADDMASGATALKRVAAQDPKLIAAKVTATEGRYGPDRETSFDIELVTRNGYDVETFFGEMLKIARHYSQDSVFISRKIQPGQSIDPTQHNPGVEVYFQDMMDAADPAMAKTLEQIKRLIQNSQGEYAGFTLITDAGVSRSQRAGEQPPVVGVRLQYIPEFDVRYGGAELDAMSPDDYSAHVVARRDELQRLANTIQKRVAGVSYAHQFWYDTEVRFSHEYDEAIRASEAGRGEAESRPGSWAGRPRREGLRAAARQSAEGGVPRVGRLPDRYGVRGDETLKFSRSGNRRGDVGGPDATGNRLGQALPQGGVAPPSFSARKPQRDAVAALAVHYSPVGGLNALDPTFAGTAFAGGERRRFGPGRFGLESPRLNFYVQEEGGPQPGKEQALASAKNGYSVRLTNLYDYATDPRGFVADTYPNADALEEEVADAGFDGILFDRVAGIPNRTAVLFGFKKKVPVAPVEDAGVFGEDRIRKSSSGTSTIMVDGVARPRTDSAGKSIHPTDGGIRNFWRWFGDSKVVDRQGRPLVVYHGTVNDIEQFDPARASIESDIGAGFYFTNNTVEVGPNYAGEGPDLTNRIEKTAERIANEEDLDMADAREQARKQLSQGLPNIIPAYLALMNPVVVGKNGQTYFDVNEEFDEETEEYGEPTGMLVDFIEAMREEAMDDRWGDIDVEKVISDVFEAAGNEGLSAAQLIDTIKNSEGAMYATDNESGDSGRAEFTRRSFELAGFDGVIDNTVDIKFGSQSEAQRKYGKGMAGMTPSTTHFIAFKPNQIKSAIGNTGAFSPAERSILKSSSAAEQPRDDLGRFAEKPEGRAPRARPDKRFSTSTKNEVMEEERALLAKDPVFSALPSRAHEDLVIEARQTLKRDPGAAEQLAYELSEGMVSTVSEEQEALLLVGKIELMKKRAEVARVAFDRRYSEERRNKARYDWDQIESRVTMLDVATKTTGAIWARTGLLRQRVLREDFTFDSMAEKLARAHGRPLTANEAEELTQMAAKIRSQEIALDEARQKLDEAADLAESQRMLTDMVTRATRYLRSETKARSRSLLDVMRQMADESRAALARMDARKIGVNRPSQRKQGGAVDVARIFHLTRIGAAELVGDGLHQRDVVEGQVPRVAQPHASGAGPAQVRLQRRPHAGHREAGACRPRQDQRNEGRADPGRPGRGRRRAHARRRLRADRGSGRRRHARRDRDHGGGHPPAAGGSAGHRAARGPPPVHRLRPRPVPVER